MNTTDTYIRLLNGDYDMNRFNNMELDHQLIIMRCDLDPHTTISFFYNIDDNLDVLLTKSRLNCHGHRIGNKKQIIRTIKNVLEHVEYGYETFNGLNEYLEQFGLSLGEYVDYELQNIKSEHCINELKHTNTVGGIHLYESNQRCLINRLDTIQQISLYNFNDKTLNLHHHRYSVSYGDYMVDLNYNIIRIGICRSQFPLEYIHIEPDGETLYIDDRNKLTKINISEDDVHKLFKLKNDNQHLFNQLINSKKC